MRPSPSRRPRTGPTLRPLLTLRRHPRLWWAIVASIALAAGWTVASVVARAEHEARAWGAPTTVVVAARDLDAGHELQPGDLRLAQRPRSVVPDGALAELPEGRSLHAAVYDGEVLVAGRLAPPGVRGLAAHLDEGDRAVAVPVEPGTAPPLAVGDHVDVLVALAPEVAGSSPPGFALAAGVRVLDVGEHAVTVAVPADAAARVAVALSQGAVTLALTTP